jgi:hypothetical protein
MEKAFARAEEIAGNIKEYINTRIESAKLGVAEKSSAIIANLVAGAIVAVVFFFFIIFAGIAVSFALGEWIGKIWAGFLIVALLYLLLGIVAWVARGKLIRLPVMNAMIKQLFKEDNEDEED